MYELWHDLEPTAPNKNRLWKIFDPKASVILIFSDPEYSGLEVTNNSEMFNNFPALSPFDRKSGILNDNFTTLSSLVVFLLSFQSDRKWKPIDKHEVPKKSTDFFRKPGPSGIHLRRDWVSIAFCASDLARLLVRNQLWVPFHIFGRATTFCHRFARNHLFTVHPRKLEAFVQQQYSTFDSFHGVVLFLSKNKLADIDFWGNSHWFFHLVHCATLFGSYWRKRNYLLPRRIFVFQRDLVEELPADRFGIDRGIFIRKSGLGNNPRKRGNFVGRSFIRIDFRDYFGVGVQKL